MESSATRTEMGRPCARVAPEGPSQGSPAKTRLTHALGWHLADLSDFEFTLVVRGRIIVKKNHLTVLKLGQLTRMAPDSVYKRWERDAVEQLAAQWSGVFCEPIPAHIELNLRVVTYMQDRRSWPDLVGTYEGPQDVLETHKPTCGRGSKPCAKHAGVIANDRAICGHVGSDRRIDPDFPRAELTISPHRRP